MGLESGSYQIESMTLMSTTILEIPTSHPNSLVRSSVAKRGLTLDGVAPVASQLILVQFITTVLKTISLIVYVLGVMISCRS